MPTLTLPTMTPLTKQRLDDTDERERLIRDILASARSSYAAGNFEQAESKYKEALSAAETYFGARSVHVANVHFQLVAFYVRIDKSHSASEHWQELRWILRW